MNAGMQERKKVNMVMCRYYNRQPFAVGKYVVMQVCIADNGMHVCKYAFMQVWRYVGAAIRPRKNAGGDSCAHASVHLWFYATMQISNT
jgi:hypothetical protein